MPKPIKGNGRYMAGLDGLRALAVLAVIAYHLHFDWIPGGLLGVGVFFVLSGYLITDLLIAEWKRNGRINLGDFWWRRARRLLPAMFVLMAVVVGWLAVFDPSRLAAMKAEMLSALFYVNNWWLIFHEVSYFESFGPPSPLGHFWSLAVEEQFYLLWPLVLLAGLLFIRQRGKLFGLTLAGAAVSALAMAFLYEPGADPSRVYYGTDTRAFGLLIGAALGMVWPSAKLSVHVSTKVRWMLNLVGGAGLLILLYMFWKINEFDDFLYQGGFVVLSLITAAVVAVIAHPAAMLGKIMGAKPLRWIGVRSYGIYLWHYPIIVLTSPDVNTNGVNLSLSLMQFAACLVLADLSWRFIEEPIRHGGLGRLWQRMKESKWKKGRVAWVTSTAVLLLVSLSFVGVTQFYPIATATTINVKGQDEKSTAHSSVPGQGQKAPDRPRPASAGGQSSSNEDQISKDPADRTGTQAGSTQAEKTGAAKPSSEKEKSDQTAAKPGSSPSQPKSPTENANHSGAPKGTVSPSETAGKNPADSANSGKEKGQKPNTDTGNETEPSSQEKVTEKKDKPDGHPSMTVRGSGQGIVVIGDSVILDAKPYLEEMLPGIIIDGKIGRQLSQALDVVNHLREQGKLGHTVILELGSNGSFTKKQMDSLLAALGEDRQIILINTRVPRPWESVVNAALQERADSSARISLVNWYEASTGKDQYFVKDGVHLTIEGAKAYAEMLVKGILAGR
ncbi:acyltransferase family protein [Brevibacillus ruminantium]|uniref:Acyltransferase family protein n=1 Tax=Brevibacillus ruminantium TaxID=2950604 RepID=A0ABY4WIS7_9BACL|nr:acyltransferase family protein [Brevibacillus ruminantium]USG65942.1 acyltransferase family protein [Brevibacillus ruminantium]